MDATRTEEQTLLLYLPRVVIIGMLTFVSACSAPASGQPTVAPPEAVPTVAGNGSWPQTEEDCESAGGRWQELGMIGVGCNLPGNDAGKPCDTIQDCDGLCLPTDPRTMVDDGSGFKIPNSAYLQQINQSGQRAEGSCSEWKSVFGCIAVVEAGKYQELCID